MISIRLKRTSYFSSNRRIRWQATAKRFLLMFIGTFLAALGYVMFQLPLHISAGGLSGIALIINSYIDFPIGMIFWFLNIPMIVLGYFYLERWTFVGRTLIGVTLMSIFIDVLNYWLPRFVNPYPLTDDLMLATVFAGVIGGIGGGIIFRSGGTSGGTSVMARVIQKYSGMPLSQVYFITDGLIIALMGVVFGWENALAGLVMLFIYGLAADYALEGASNTRTLTIITQKPKIISQAVINHLQKGTSYWEITGGFTGETRYMVMTTIYRSQLTDALDLISEVDPHSFVTVGVSHHALGVGFMPLKKSVKAEGQPEIVALDPAASE